MTLTAQRQLDDAFTSSSWLPVESTAVTEFPDAAVSDTAGLAPGFEPVGNANTWNAGPATGAGVHWYAQPIFHGALAVVKGVLIQVPCDCIGPSRMLTGPGLAVVGTVEDPLGGADVVGAGGADVVVTAPGTDDPGGGGTV